MDTKFAQLVDGKIGFSVRGPRTKKRPHDWRNQDHILVAIGKDIFVHQLGAVAVASKWGISRRTVSRLIARLKPPNLERVRIVKVRWEWRPKKVTS